MYSRIFKNSTYLLAAQAFTKFVSFFYTIYLARALGVEDFGLYIVALSYFSLVAAIGDFGITRFLVREVAKDTHNAQVLLVNILMLRLSLLSVFFGFFALAIHLYDPDRMRSALTMLAVLAVIPQAVALTFDGVFVAFQRLSYSSIGLVVLSLTSAFLGYFFVLSGNGPLGAAAGLVFGQVIYAIVMGGILLKMQVKIFSKVTAKILIDILKGSLPYGLLGVLGLLYFKVDTILLSYLKGSYETGIYGAGYKFLEAVIFIPSAISTAMFPVLAKLHEGSIVKVRKLYYKSLGIFVGLSLLIFAAYLLILPWFIVTYLPQYLPSIDVIRILSFSLPFMFAHSPGVLVLLSTDRYLKPIIALSFLTLGFNVIANLIFIPKYGFIGSAYITVFSEILSFVVFYLLLRTRVFKE